MQQRYLELIDDVAKTALKCGRSADDLTVVAVSKTQPAEAVKVLYEAGCRDFGESRVQEALSKMDAAPLAIRWHLIGNLQSKKVKKVIGRFALIHSVDTPELAQYIAQASLNQQVVTPILLQVNTSGEASKHGLSPSQWKDHFEQVLHLPGVVVKGLMTMAPLTDDTRRIADCFAGCRKFKEDLSKTFAVELPHLSMGMSHDYPIAIAEGATLLRVGTHLFSDRKD